MHSNLKLQLRFESTGIIVDALDADGHMLVSRHIGKEKVFHWIAEHADRSIAVGLDTAVTFAIERDEEKHGRPSAHGNLAGLFDSCAIINQLAAGLEVAS